jgi:hypothetical protein
MAVKKSWYWFGFFILQRRIQVHCLQRIKSKGIKIKSETKWQLFIKKTIFFFFGPLFTLFLKVCPSSFFSLLILSFRILLIGEARTTRVIKKISLHPYHQIKNLSCHYKYQEDYSNTTLKVRCHFIPWRQTP